MAEGTWGNCKGCRYFASDKPNPSDNETQRCMQASLRKFDLKVSGASGCNAYEARVGVGSQPQQEPAQPAH
ncbi:hypothetical protein OWM54_27085 [Myxococcus sp. MISCRS1]|uniref:hypothetical protein n=1 Tax=Myxococcus TaxID=32 RepID=UPI00226F2C6D|nr:hypothetical protein [Myxococcus sp. MISCRS1]MCY1000820.1 hypothetical protein [Myxococcus sp. MISCRS1]BDT37634.1 hypothetical protein MFMH1_73030 [Myxococcus sp. MH1]